MRRKNMLSGNSGRLATVCLTPCIECIAQRSPHPSMKSSVFCFFTLRNLFLSMRLRDCKTRLFLFFSLVWSWYSPFDFRVSLWGSLLRHSDKHRLASHIVRASNFRSGGHEFESPVRQELGALTKSGKTLGVRSFYNLQAQHMPESFYRMLNIR